MNKYWFVSSEVAHRDNASEGESSQNAPIRTDVKQNKKGYIEAPLPDAKEKQRETRVRTTETGEKRSEQRGERRDGWSGKEEELSAPR